MSGIVIVYTLYGDRAEAERAASAIVQDGLAACANLLPAVESHYMWNGLFEKQAEYPVLFKTSATRRDTLMARIGAEHPYDVPAILSWDAGAAAPYAQWVADMTV